MITFRNLAVVARCAFVVVAGLSLAALLMATETGLIVWP